MNATERPVIACVTNNTIANINIQVLITNPFLLLIADSGDGRAAKSICCSLFFDNSFLNTR